MSCWEVGVLTAVFPLMFKKLFGSLCFDSLASSYLDHCQILWAWEIYFLWPDSSAPLNATHSIALVNFTFFLLRAGSQIAGEQPLTPTVLLVYVELISLTNIVPLFHFSRGTLLNSLRRFESLKRLCEEAGRTLRNCDTEKKKGFKSFSNIPSFPA